MLHIGETTNVNLELYSNSNKESILLFHERERSSLMGIRDQTSLQFVAELHMEPTSCDGFFQMNVNSKNLKLMIA